MRGTYQIGMRGPVHAWLDTGMMGRTDSHPRCGRIVYLHNTVKSPGVVSLAGVSTPGEIWRAW